MTLLFFSGCFIAKMVDDGSLIEAVDCEFMSETERNIAPCEGKMKSKKLMAASSFCYGRK